MEHAKFRSREALTLSIAGLPPDITAAHIEDWVSRFDCNYDVDFEASLGEASVHIEPSSVGTLIARERPPIKGYSVEVKVLLDSAGHAREMLDRHRRKIFVNGLPPSTKEKEVWNILSIYGELRDLQLTEGNANQSLLCYADYVHKASAKRAIKNGIILHKAKHRVYKYRTQDKLQSNFEKRLQRLAEFDLGFQSQSSLRDPQPQPRHRRPNRRKRNPPAKKENLKNSGHHTESRKLDIASHLLKPNQRVYHSQFEQRSPTMNNHLYRLLPPSNKKNIYHKTKVKEASIYFRIYAKDIPREVKYDERISFQIPLGPKQTRPFE